MGQICNEIFNCLVDVLKSEIPKIKNTQNNRKYLNKSICHHKAAIKS